MAVNTMAVNTVAVNTTLAEEDCCARVLDGVLESAEAERLAAMLKVVADPARLRLLSVIASADDAEACVCELTEPMRLSQPTVSHHLKVLHDAGFVTRERRGQWVYYTVVPESLERLRGAFATPRRRRRR